MFPNSVNGEPTCLHSRQKIQLPPALLSPTAPTTSFSHLHVLSILLLSHLFTMLSSNSHDVLSDFNNPQTGLPPHHPHSGAAIFREFTLPPCLTAFDKSPLPKSLVKHSISFGIRLWFVLLCSPLAKSPLDPGWVGRGLCFVCYFILSTDQLLFTHRFSPLPNSSALPELFSICRWFNPRKYPCVDIFSHQMT